VFEWPYITGSDWVAIGFAGVFAFAGATFGNYLSERSARRRQIEARAEAADRAAVKFFPVVNQLLRWAKDLPSTSSAVTDPDHQLIGPPHVVKAFGLDAATTAMLDLPTEERSAVGLALGFAEMLTQSVSSAASASKQVRGISGWLDEGRG
jgi:hypothetical protein